MTENANWEMNKQGQFINSSVKARNCNVVREITVAAPFEKWHSIIRHFSQQGVNSLQNGGKGEEKKKKKSVPYRSRSCNIHIGKQ